MIAAQQNMHSVADFFHRTLMGWLKDMSHQPHRIELPKIPPPSISTRCVEPRSLRLLPTPSPIHFWGKHICWDDNVDEVENLDNREIVFSEWWESSLDRVYYRLTTRKGRELWLYRTAGGDFLQGEFE